MANNAKRRAALFDLYAKNAALYLDLAADLFICPICGDGFTSKALDEPLEVDVAHVHPSSCGGELETLTCRKCNNRMGSRYDSQLAIEHRTHTSIRSAERPLAARLVFEGGDVGVRVFRTGNHFDIKMMKEWTKAEHGQLLETTLKTGSPKFTLKHRWVDQDRLSVAVLHSAYLALFREYGYEYVLYAHTKWIREILNADNPPSDPFFFTVNLPDDSGFDRAALYGTGIAEYEGMRFLAVALPSPQPEMPVRCVLLPGIGEEAMHNFSSLLTRPEPEGKVNVLYHFDYGVPEKRLADRKWRGFLHYILKKPIASPA
jgi:hypothetical protein